ncbi:MAG: hypothetical protein A2W17_09110 [Planctomycetes bacterium RBG_16_41_13]|nr:MAG: hypothetical protein A2W17_09110 [Planctomycetes bacterium RBG_16_41_13]
MGSVPIFSYILYFIAKHLGAFEVSKLNAVVVRRFCADAVTKDGLKASTVNQYNSVLKLILNMAVQERIITANPLDGFKPLSVDETHKRILTDEEIQLLVNETVLPPGRDRMIMLIGLFTGIRLMDIATLKWGDIDLHNASLTLTQQKTGRTNTLPLSSFLTGELRKYKTSADNTAGDYLFHDGTVITHATHARWSTHFVKVFKGLDLKGISFHNLRHTNATKIVEVVQDVSIASRMLGHSSLNTTAGYLHPGMESKRDAVEKFTQHMLRLTRYEAGTNQKTA